MVFIDHYNPFSEQRFGKPTHDFFSEFYLGVTIFFVLSGFLITYKYFDNKDFSFRQYMVNRIARIYPMYFLLTSITFIVFNLNGNDDSSLSTYLLNITFMRGFFDQYIFSGIGQGWSLTVEETFYILAPLFFVLIVRSKPLLFMLPVAFLLTGFVIVKIFSPFNFHGFFTSNHFMFTYTFFGRCFEFFVGMALAVVVRTKKSLDSKISLTYFGAVVIIICIWSMSLLRAGTLIGIEHPLGRLINSIVLPIAGISLFFYGLLTEETVISKILGSKLLVLLGKSSYIFYLIHIGVIAAFIQSNFQNSMVIFVAINLISIVLFRFVEDPLNRFIRRSFSHRFTD